MIKQANVIGVNMVMFEKPGRNDPYDILASKAIKNDLEDAGITLTDVNQPYAGYIYGDPRA
ncbi:hypothetical protein [Neobacillus kokaensis]|uniref:Uncharacterized protein n=1 Tax=Neobacillus kokaensis TaxID=2759023 RepID=A0ABQ3N5X5_9BACI|nr:hypothetical protein [Neobacillus kokaensis]GHH98992.1 hypothetical protein AM1BK_25350 [Neobacillus kokaensis]